MHQGHSLKRVMSNSCLTKGDQQVDGAIPLSFILLLCFSCSVLCNALKIISVATCSSQIFDFDLQTEYHTDCQLLPCPTPSCLKVSSEMVLMSTVGPAHEANAV